MLKEFTQSTYKNSLLTWTTGLRLENKDGAKGLQKTVCPACKKPCLFCPEKFVWDADDDFEFCDVECPECKAIVEINARAEIVSYEFFMS